MNCNLLKFSFLIVGLSVGLQTKAAAAVTEGELKDKFAAIMNFTLGESNPEFPQIRFYAGRTTDQRTCVVTQSASGRASEFEVLTLDKSGAVDSEPLSYEFSMRRKYDEISLSVAGSPTKGRLDLSTTQSLGGTSKVAYQIVVMKGPKGPTDFHLSYKNLSARANSGFVQSVDCLGLSPLLALNPSNLGSLAGSAKSVYERTQKDQLGAYLKTLVPKCELESATTLSCEFAYESPR
ncbi:MAG: hypothetical protein K2X47_19450, partial [Bdellovibrionales bacterium]|nr:hypothetical protein [Bdellovibrionales bacterium]